MEKIYTKIVVEFDSPLCKSDRLVFKNCTFDYVLVQFGKWCDHYNITVESTNPRTIEVVE